MPGSILKNKEILTKVIELVESTEKALDQYKINSEFKEAIDVSNNLEDIKFLLNQIKTYQSSFIEVEDTPENKRIIKLLNLKTWVLKK